jgi:hypothetical protein
LVCFWNLNAKGGVIKSEFSIFPPRRVILNTNAV